MEKNKTLKITEETHRKLKALGNKDESFDDVIKRLLEIGGGLNEK